MKPMIRIATYLHEGRDMKAATPTAARLDILRETGELLAAHPEWHPLDAVVFPGGFLPDIPDSEARAFARRLKRLSPGLQLVLGVDRDGEQLAVAFTEKGRSGLARKIFPVGEDVDGKTMPPIVLHEKDFDDPARLIRLPSGGRALLCVCYDMFGLGDAVRGKMDKLAKAVAVEDAAGRVLHGQKDMRRALERAFNAHRRFITREKPDAALATIHRFAEPGREIFWQRHGIASASAALRGGFAVAAAHTGSLPADAAAMTLSASRVPPSHLGAGMKRQAHMLAPEAHAAVVSGKSRGLLRLFSR